MTPWYDQYRDTLMDTLNQSDHECIRHYVSGTCTSLVEYVIVTTVHVLVRLLWKCTPTVWVCMTNEVKGHVQVLTYLCSAPGGVQWAPQPDGGILTALCQTEGLRAGQTPQMAHSSPLLLPCASA